MKKYFTFHKLAMEICRREGGKKSLDIAQIKEVLSIVVQLFREFPIAMLKFFVGRL